MLTSDRGSECERRFFGFSGTASNLVVPEMSYSSSEGEEDFFDADDSPFTPGSQTQTPT